jgi:hypothetical protein
MLTPLFLVLPTVQNKDQANVTLPPDERLHHVHKAVRLSFTLRKKTFPSHQRTVKKIVLSKRNS